MKSKQVSAPAVKEEQNEFRYVRASRRRKKIQQKTVDTLSGWRAYRIASLVCACRGMIIN